MCLSTKPSSPLRAEMESTSCGPALREVLAQRIHSHSRRKDRTMIKNLEEVGLKVDRQRGLCEGEVPAPVEGSVTSDDG